jgi:hypothetical protein
MNFTDRAVVAAFVVLAFVNLPATFALHSKGLATLLVACLQAAIWAVAGQAMESHWFEALLAAWS